MLIYQGVYTQWQLPFKKHLAATLHSFIVGDPDVSKRTSGTAQGIQLGARGVVKIGS
jgi:hypothetical protein